MSISDCQSIIKKAIVERLKKVYKLNVFPEGGPRYRSEFTITKDKVILALDSTGDGLHKRGYRNLVYTAPLQETLAAAMIKISRWSPGRILIDPFCGSGTIPIEAALMAMNKAPGLDNARQAGVSDAVHFQVRDMKELSSRAKYGFVITNPPYGERLGAKKENIILYKQMGEHYERLSTWSFYIINADPDFEKNFGKKANKNRKLYNGGLLC